MTPAHIHERCGQLHDEARNHPCPCVREPMAVRRATAEVARRHRASVEAARRTDELIARCAA